VHCQQFTQCRGERHGLDFSTRNHQSPRGLFGELKRARSYASLGGLDGAGSFHSLDQQAKLRVTKSVVSSGF
jgi:hypothetical protein